jgi:hypothetical protein
MTIGMASPSGKVGNKIPSGYKMGQLQQFTPEQMQLFSQMFSHVSPDSFTGQIAGGNQEAFNQMEAPALKQFAGLQGGLASRFSGMGQGARNSSGFQNSMNQASSDFAQQLQSNRLGLQRQALGDLMNMSNQLLGQRPFEQFLVKKDQQTPWWKQALGLVSPAAGDAVNGTNNSARMAQMMMGSPGGGGGGFGSIFNG